jgi:hypothetical protein
MKINWGKIESTFADIFKFGITAAVIAEPIVVKANPGISAVYDLSVNAAIQADSAADEAASTAATNIGKVAAITAAIQPILIQAAQAAGVASPTTTHINTYAQSVIDGLNVLNIAASPTPTN